MKLRSLRLFLLPLAATVMVCLNSCCCPWESKAELLEDFWVSPEQQVQWLEKQRAMSGQATAYDASYNDPAYGSTK